MTLVRGCLRFTLGGEAPEEPALHVILNMHDFPRQVALPVLDGRSWRRIIDTAVNLPR